MQRYLPNIHEALNVHEAPGTLNMYGTLNIHETLNLHVVLIQPTFGAPLVAPGVLCSRNTQTSAFAFA